VREAVVSARPEVLIHQLTALPRELNMRKYFEQLEPTNRVRAQTTPYFLAAAREAGALGRSSSRFRSSPRSRDRRSSTSPRR
jgi:hypothetical protein